jgi:hypothetical protein
VNTKADAKAARAAAQREAEKSGQAAKETKGGPTHK